MTWGKWPWIRGSVLTGGVSVLTLSPCTPWQSFVPAWGLCCVVIWLWDVAGGAILRPKASMKDESIHRHLWSVLGTSVSKSKYPLALMSKPREVHMPSIGWSLVFHLWVEGPSLPCLCMMVSCKERLARADERSLPFILEFPSMRRTMWSPSSRNFFSSWDKSCRNADRGHLVSLVLLKWRLMGIDCKGAIRRIRTVGRQYAQRVPISSLKPGPAPPA